MAVEKFEAVVESVSGLKVSCKSREFEFFLDEPKSLGGTNVGMNPVEALLNSLGACKVIVAKSFARLHKMKINSIRIELEGELDTDGFMGKNPDAKVGFSKIITNFYIDADNTDEEIAAYVDFINRTCPVADTIENAPEMVSNIIK
ncbi:MULTISPECIES: OsmC family protein [Vagococcus]|uniref:OsmC family protein n=1 Tax=Vagococcus TaxID=2737 RepID=UPI002FC99A8E